MRWGVWKIIHGLNFAIAKNELTTLFESVDRAWCRSLYRRGLNRRVVADISIPYA